MKKAVVITGASSGIGKAIAEMAVNSGYTVVNLDLNSSDCKKVRSVQVDLTDSKAVTETLTNVGREFEIAALINNAGFARTSPLEETDDILLQKTFDLNLRCAVRCARMVLPGMKRRGFGRIINVSSRSALGRELRTAYAASKGGLISMTRVWALELGRYGITANCVAPGPIATELFDDMNPNGTGRRKKMISEIPVGRIGTPADVAHAVQFFLSPGSGYVTGQTLYVCGGLSAGVAPV